MNPPYVFIGVDPGPTPGVVRIVTGSDDRGRWVDCVDIIQCSAGILYRLIDSLDPNKIAQLQVEKFVTRGRANTAQAITRDQVAVLQQVYANTRPIVQRTAREVKPWATDERLEAAGLLEQLKGMRHAKDAARHAMYAAVKAGAANDPLSTRKATK